MWRLSGSVFRRETSAVSGMRVCQFYKLRETGCKAGDKRLFPHHKVDEQPNKKTKKSDHSQKRRESDDKNAVAIVEIVSQMGCASHDSESLHSHRGKRARGNPMQKVLGPKTTIHSVFATSSKYPGKETTIAGKNTSQKSSSAKSLHYEI